MLSAINQLIFKKMYNLCPISSHLPNVTAACRIFAARRPSRIYWFGITQPFRYNSLKPTKTRQTLYN